ncbi:MAG TPA: hypothetical protein VLW06_15520 [Terriglobales bacterium]|nr:hypothetical protein [Terriglobales bacterium]
MNSGGITFKILVVALLLPVIAGIALGADAPSKMIHVILQMSGSDIPADSFFSKPKVFWHASNRYCRVDEEPDPDNGIHGRLLMNEPDAWLINLADNTAKHLIDKGPTFNCKLPIFSLNEEMAKGKIGDLEVGHEIEYFQTNGAKQIDGPKVHFEAKYYELKVGDSSLRLVERVDIHAPIMIGLATGGELYTARYLLWEEVPFDENLFAKPTGLKIEEVK